MKKSELNITEIIEEYKKCSNLHKLAKKFKTSHIRLSKLLKENNIKINNLGNKKDLSNDDINNMINDYLVNHLTIENISKKYGVRIKRLRSIFRERGVIISKWNGHVKKVKKNIEKKIKEKKPTKKCPYCDWETIDIENKSSAYIKHLINFHNINIDEHLKNYPDDIFYLKKNIIKNELIKCEICGKYLHLIDKRHLDKHNITKQEYIEKYGDNLTSSQTKSKLQNCLQKMYGNKNWDRKTSSYEIDIKNFLIENNVEIVQHDRQILNGLEIDFLCNNIGIEFNGNKFHTEWFGGKDRNYHLNKTNICNEQGIKLLQIFEDEYNDNREIVLNKILHIVKKDTNLPKIMARKCDIVEIDKGTAEIFLNQYHIQGFASSTVYLGCFYESNLVGVMTFKKECKDGYWELNRFASDYNYICQGVGGKLFKYFIKKYNPIEVKSFADRRWTIDKDNNLYTKLGFTLEKVLKPDYKYYNPKVDKYKRFHKFNFRKETLHKKYGFDMSMTETEMVQKLGYDKIWDCGLFKYVWKK